MHLRFPLQLKTVNDTGTIIATFYDVRGVKVVHEHGSTKTHVAVYNADAILPECFPLDDCNKRALVAWQAAISKDPSA